MFRGNTVNSCFFCFRFTRKIQLKSHIKEYHQTKKGPKRACKICDKNVNWDLREHIAQFHFMIIPYQCRLCPARYNYKPNFFEHAKQYHSETSPLMCLEETFDYWFTNKSQNTSFNLCHKQRPKINLTFFYIACKAYF